MRDDNMIRTMENKTNIEALMERMKIKSKNARDEKAELKRAHDQVEDLYRTLRAKYPLVSNAQIVNEIGEAVGYSATNVRWILRRRGAYQSTRKTAKRGAKLYDKKEEK